MDWVSVEKELPPLETDIIFVANGERYYGRAFESVEGAILYELRPSRIDYHVFRHMVTHWMMVPEPPNT